MCRYLHTVLFLLLLLATASASPMAEELSRSAPPLPAECAGTDAVFPQGELLTDWQCLRRSYPQLHCLRADTEGRLWLELADGRRVLYDGGQPFAAGQWDVDVRASMAQPYPLDPQRPSTPSGVSPGRWRSYALLRTLYGSSAAAIRPRLRTGMFFGQAVRMEAQALAALQRVEARLAPIVASQPQLRSYLKSAGGFHWRGIAGENGRLSPHSFGIAIDLSPRKAPYWRWSRVFPHPLQASYPEAIVTAFEAEGFVWGGKWHEYDIMHFEYRPEILCKARTTSQVPDVGGEALSPDVSVH
ncbi:M15 family metallopeptidase [uncultured Desulfovibrio sp.]|uniref:M15 family metallopeptidase n=1 Tax=uncultured Desulfovibrio sp. TaxID=167968 RepID=UPI002618C46A|nr:M15 family metallopeptidase [uncultured Desulfovibrio sp.]